MTRTPPKHLSLAALTLAAVAAVAICHDAGAQAPVEPAPATAPPTPVYPNYQFLRQNENWSAFDAAAGDDWFDPIKHVPLVDDGSIWAGFGGDLRMRIEGWNNFNFGAHPPGRTSDEVFVLGRFMFHGDVHFGENVRVFGQFKSALSTDRDLPGGRRTLDVDAAALQQLFVDLRLPFDDDLVITLRPGRQMLLFGKQRLVSPLPWANTLRAWDGLSVIAEVGDWKVHAFGTQFVPVQKYKFNDPDRQTLFWGVYATGKAPMIQGVGLDLYYLGLDRDDAQAFNGTVGDEERHTLGGRIFGKIGDTGFDYDLEGAYQFGEVGEGDVSAFMIGSQLGYAFADLAWKPRVHVGFDYGSGDDSPGGDVETFNQLFPLGHAYLGFIDTIGRQNIIDVNTGVTVKPIDKLSVGLDGHFFWRADDDDALYNAGGGVVRPGSAAGDRYVGAELDLTVKYQFDRHTSALFGYSHFFTGDFINNSGRHDDIDFVYLELSFTF